MENDLTVFGALRDHSDTDVVLRGLRPVTPEGLVGRPFCPNTSIVEGMFVVQISHIISSNLYIPLIFLIPDICSRLI